MKADFTKDDDDKKPAGKKDQLQLASGVELSQDLTPVHTAAAASNQAPASKRSRRPPSEQDDDDSSSVASSTSSTRPGAVHMGDTESNHDEWTLQTEEEPDMEQGFETILPIAAEVDVPNDDSENNKRIAETQVVVAEAQIVKTAKVCGQPRWLILALLGVLVVLAIVAGMGVALSNDPSLTVPSPATIAPDPSPAPTIDRRKEVEEIIRARIPSFQLGPSQIQTLNWLADDDPATLDFELVSTDEVLEQFVLALLYFSTKGENWGDSSGFLSASSICSWKGVSCDTSKDVIEMDLYSNNLNGLLPTELGLLTNLEGLGLCKFATVPGRCWTQ